MKTVSVSGRVPMLFNMSKYCVISSKSTTSLELAPLICSLLRARASQLYRPVRKSFRLASEAAFSVGSRPRADQDDKTAPSSFRDDAMRRLSGLIGWRNPCP